MPTTDPIIPHEPTPNATMKLCPECRGRYVPLAHDACVLCAMRERDAAEARLLTLRDER